MEKTWQIFLMGVLATVLGVIIYFITAPKHVVRYDLSGQYSEGIPEIKVDIENSFDETIRLSKDITWPEAIHMVDSLNQIIKTHPIK